MTRLLRWYLGIGTAVLVAHVVLPPSLGRAALGLAVGLASLGALVVGVRGNRPEHRAPWMLLGAGAAAFVLGDIALLGIQFGLAINQFGQVAGVLLLVGYPAFSGGVYLISRARNPGGDLALLDSMVAGVAVTLVMWVAFIEPTWTAVEGILFHRLVSVAYPITHVLLIVQLAYLGVSGLRRSRSLHLVVGALTLSVLGGLAFQASFYLPAMQPYLAAIDTVWLASYLLLGAAALDRSMVEVTDPGPARRVQLVGVGKLVFVAFAMIPVPLTVLVEVLLGQEPHLVEAGVAAILVTALFLVRMAKMARQMGRQALRLAELAEADVLTGLANRRRFCAAVDDVLGATGPNRAPEPVPLLLVVLDRFTEVNDTLGHRVGDELLCAAARRMEASVGPLSLVGRLGGDSFGVQLVGEGVDPESALALAVRLQVGLTEPYELSDVTVSVDALVGVAIGPEDGTSSDDLLQRADVALSVAREGASRVARYSGRMSSGGALTPHLLGELQAALDAGDVVVHYQPQVDLRSGRVLGVEALVRWQHPEHGLLPPGAFIPAAERTGLIRPLTAFVLDSALEQLATWRSSGWDLRVAVNLSVRNLLDRGFVDDVCQALARHGVAEDSLDLEITESMVMVDPDRSIEVLGGLDALGVVLSVDDYGTGHSSLAYLQRLPVRQLKIDRSFVMGMLDNDASAVIVRSTIDLARNLGMSVVAEGVEDDVTLLALRDMRCDTAQGFGIGRPVPANQVLSLIERIEARLPLLLGPAIAVQRTR